MCPPNAVWARAAPRTRDRRRGADLRGTAIRRRDHGGRRRRGRHIPGAAVPVLPGKRTLFAAVYRRAAERLLDGVRLGPQAPLEDQIASGLDAHLDYFLANRNTVLAANRTLATDPAVQDIINAELAALRDRIADAADLEPAARQRLSAVMISWLAFVRVLCVQWLADGQFTRDEVRACASTSSTR
ncbi:transcriptional regulator, TetR family [Mycobacterium xenopi 4042]|uniref:Transcriptional regulator, TetR family n=1 Tax=Mycobacterium xenopi 4042 TaxID=1299334 RepID=X8DXS5_MYCXE|nr:transcriptional regulator, TetR family [Mycobacterium xenopi 4042]